MFEAFKKLVIERNSQCTAIHAICMVGDEYPNVVIVGSNSDNYPNYVTWRVSFRDHTSEQGHYGLSFKAACEDMIARSGFPACVCAVAQNATAGDL